MMVTVTETPLLPVIVTVLVPLRVGVPEIWPVVVLKVRPVGSPVALKVIPVGDDV
jgi:hypothetical protein